MVRACLAEVHAWCTHYFTQSVSFDGELILWPTILVFGVIVDDGSRDGWNTLNDHSREPIFEILHHKGHFVSTVIIRLNVDLIFFDDINVLLFHLKFFCFEYRVSYCGGCNL